MRASDDRPIKPAKTAQEAAAASRQTVSKAAGDLRAEMFSSKAVGDF